MADRRSEDAPVAPPRSLGSPRESEETQAPSGESPAPRPETGAAPQSSDDLTGRINAAYASTPPILPDETDGAARPTGAERFAAVLAATRSRMTGETPVVPGEPVAKPAPAKPAARRVRKARLRLTHLDPWSVMKTSFLLSIAFGIVTVVAVAVVMWVIGAAGVFASIDKTVGDVVGDNGGAPFRIEDYLGMSRVMGFTLIVAVVDVVLVTVIATLGAFLYNLAAALLGGLEVVLAEDER